MNQHRYLVLIDGDKVVLGSEGDSPPHPPRPAVGEMALLACYAVLSDFGYRQAHLRWCGGD